MKTLLKNLFMNIFNLIDYDDYNDVVNENQRKGREIEKLSRKLEDAETFLNKLPNILSSNYASIYDVFNDRNDRLCYICHFEDKDKVQNNGFFVLNADLLFLINDSGYNKFPYIESKYIGNTIFISELHADVCNGSKDEISDFENNGYATRLLYTVLTHYKKTNYNDNYSNCKVKGKLSFVDAQTNSRKTIRNDFYENLNFEMKFKDENQKDGSFAANYSSLLNKIEDKIRNKWN